VGLLDGRVVLVTGGGRGLGRAHCLEIARHGGTVVVNDVGAGVGGEGRDDSPADEVAQLIRDVGGTAIVDHTSVSDFAGVGALVQRIVDELGALDAVVNNAGILRDRMLTSMSEEEFDAVIDVHLKGTWNVTRHACSYWRAQNKAGTPRAARIVNTTSGAGLFGNVGQTNYAPAKAGIAALTICTAMEMGRNGVTANAISPIARTRMTAGIGSFDDETAGPFDPLDPATTSPVAAWLCSEESGWLSGQVLRVDGDTVIRVEPWSIKDPIHYRGTPNEPVDATALGLGLRVAYGAFPGGIPSSPLNG
jgi:NAD(P)-dependent dehydrogenase (short-subunit alcohol dehydrogenase family)